MSAALLALSVSPCFAQDAPAKAAAPDAAPAPAAKPIVPEIPKTVSLDTSETLFTVLAMVNHCGYDVELNTSDPLRSQIRAEVTQAVQSAADLGEAAKAMCDYYNEHKQSDPARTLAQYISLALYLEPAPSLGAKVKEAEMPPDAAALISAVPIIQNFYKQAEIHTIWEKHAAAYADLTQGYHQALAKMMFETEVYLKLPSAGYLGRGFTVYLDPMGAPSQINARNYGTDYYIVISPGAGTSVKMDQIRHTYLHYLLDPMALKYPTELKHVEPIMATVKTAPMDENFKNDVSLLVTECIIRAVEARTLGNKKTPESERLAAVQESVHQGYVLTSYFYNALIPFEKDPASLRNAMQDMLAKIDTRAEYKQAEQLQFVSKADSDVLHLEGPGPNKLLVEAEKRLNSKDPVGAQKLAQQVLDEKTGDSGRALFILAEAATMTKNMKGAVDYFQQALTATQEPKVIAWSHIYLGRIFDLQEDRDSAVDHYKAALTASTDLPEAKAAAQRGLDKAYAPPASQQNQSQNQNPTPQQKQN